MNSNSAVAAWVTKTSISPMDYPTTNSIQVFHDPEKSVASQLFGSRRDRLPQKPRRNRHKRLITRHLCNFQEKNPAKFNCFPRNRRLPLVNMALSAVLTIVSGLWHPLILLFRKYRKKISLMPNSSKIHRSLMGNPLILLSSSS